ncbi:hypothetical protein MASR1M66_23360 [Aminivibrio sp.]
MCKSESFFNSSRIYSENRRSGKALRIGVVGPESGGGAQLGQGQRKAVQLTINSGNLAGEWKLEVFSRMMRQSDKVC